MLRKVYDPLNLKVNETAENSHLDGKRRLIERNKVSFGTVRQKSLMELKGYKRREPIVVESMSSLLKSAPKSRAYERASKNSTDSDDKLTRGFTKLADVEGISTEIGRKIKLPTYLLPTASFKMKCVQKMVNDKKNTAIFPKIPFVVGNSVKSHNIGTKMQETLFLIKGAPRRVLEKNGREEKELSHLMRAVTPQHSPPIDRSSTKLNKVEIIKRHYSAVSLEKTTVAAGLKTLRCKTVLTNLYREYSALSKKHTELTRQLSNRYDPTTDQHIHNLEEDMNSKEIEIDTFIKLFNEANELRNKFINQRKNLNNSPSTTTLKPTNVRQAQGDCVSPRSVDKSKEKMGSHSRGDNLQNTLDPTTKRLEFGKGFKMKEVSKMKSTPTRSEQ